MNKIKVARNKLSRVKQIKEVASFNEDYRKILLEISMTITEEIMDRFCKGLKPYVCNKLSIEKYTALNNIMCFANMLNLLSGDSEK